MANTISAAATLALEVILSLAPSCPLRGQIPALGHRSPRRTTIDQLSAVPSHRVEARSLTSSLRFTATFFPTPNRLPTVTRHDFGDTASSEPTPPDALCGGEERAGIFPYNFPFPAILDQLLFVTKDV